MQEYPITVDLFTDAKCYKTTSKCSREGIQVHSVGCKGTNAARWKKSWNTATATTCGGYIIDMDGITQCLKEGAKCWLSGKGENGNANNTHLGFEICEPLTRLDTDEVAADLYGKTLYLCVYLCRLYGIAPSKVQAHYELHALGLASNHADVRHWWGKAGTAWEPYTMDRLRADIASELGVTLTYSATLSLGSSGDAVKSLQTMLAAAEYYTDEVDGDYGAKTKAAVQEYQKVNSLYVDGICGPKTWESIYSTNEQEAVTDAGAEAVASGDADADASTMPVLRKGLKGDNVKTLQTLLFAGGHTDSDGNALIVDGDFGAKTEAALKEHQRANGLEPDGVCGSITWASIDAAVSALGEGTVTDVPLTLEQRVAALELRVAALEAK